MALSSPKQTATERQASLFPYYAGFSEAFVRDVLGALEARTDQVVLDPWNGSGTTTTVAGGAGFCSIGIDINPALAVVANARLANERDIRSARQLVTGNGRKLTRKFLVERCFSPYDSASKSILLLGIFRLVRNRLRNLVRVGTNPTWWQISQSEVKQVLASITMSQLDAELLEVGSKLSTPDCARNNVSLIRADLVSSKFQPIAADIIITSPPYLTRIDYVKATLPELFVLSLLEDFSFDELRRAMIGSPVVGRGPDSMPRAIGSYAKSILSQVASHESKASATYYLGFFSTYLSKMYDAFAKLGAMTRPGGKMVIVVQGSHYKQIFVDLARLSIDLAGAAGFEILSRADFNFKQSFVQLNPRANGYGLDTAQESVLLFERNY